MKKAIIIIVFLALHFSILGNQYADTTKSKGFSTSKLSIGIGFSLYSFIKYELVNYPNLNPPYTGQCDKCDPYKKATYWNGIYFDYQSINFGYSFADYLKVGVGFHHSIDRIYYGNVSIDTIRENVIIVNDIGDITNKHAGVSPSITLLLNNTFKKRFYTTLSGGLNVDFILSEQYKGAFEVIDSVYYPYNNHDVVVLSKTAVEEEPVSRQMAFNRISPFLNLSFEWFSRRRLFSFSVGTSVVMRPIYLANNTRVVYKYNKITPVVVGLSFYLK
jgi:hypothetical protein